MFNINWLEPFRELLSPRADLSFRVMRFFGRLYIVRRLVSFGKFAKEYECKRADSNNKVFEHIQNLETNGYSLGLMLDEKQVECIIKYCNESLFFDSSNPSKKFRINYGDLNTKPGLGTIYRLLDPHEQCACIKEVALSEEIDCVAKRYLGPKAKLMGTQIWYTFPSFEKEYNPDFGFHYDLDDYGFLKIFFYLNNVTKESGPHEIIEATHKGDQYFKFFNRRLRPSLVQKKYGHRVVTMLGHKGQGFFEDTFSYHRGLPPRRTRLIFQIQYAISNRKWNN